MPQQHLDRLSAVDASFLHQEGPSSHMHIGGVVILEGPAPEFERFIEHLRSRLHRVPRYRQKLAHPPLDTGRPLWIDDPDFNLEFHVRHTALPAPGSEEQLLNLVARTFSQQLDRSKPLWEMWLVQGLEGGRFALISKTHHSLVDGVSGVDLAQVLFDLTPEPAAGAGGANGAGPWQPAPAPSGSRLVASGLRGLVRGALETTGRALEAATNPAYSLGRLGEALEGVGEIGWAILNPAPATPLNVEIGPHRRFLGVRLALADLKTIKDAFGGTVNDVVLTAVAGSLRRFLRARGVRVEGLELRALVPMSVRAKDERGALGNKLALMRGPLPVYIGDPLERLQAVRAAMDGIKESKQAVGAKVLADVQQFAPPTILAQASRLQFSTRLFNLIVTNVPGPQFPIYVLGREMLDIFPVAFLPRGHALAIAIMSYNGGINFGLLADYDSMPDLEDVGAGIDDAVRELLELARERTASGGAGSAGGGRPAGRSGATVSAGAARRARGDDAEHGARSGARAARGGAARAS